jgi:regulator of sigma E protease
MSTTLIFLVILLVLVIVHEFGHFIMAKWSNMRVDEFAFGFPPRIFSKKVGETTYSFNALPLGGFVSIWGENGSEEDKEKDGAKNHPRAFGNRPWYLQLFVLFAGVFMNMLLAWMIFVFTSYGEIKMSVNDEQYGSYVKNPSLMIADASIEGPAYKAGMIPGSTIVDVRSVGKIADLSNASSLILFIGTHQNDPITFTYKRPDSVTSSTTIAAVYGIVPDKKAVGISIENIGVMDSTALQALSIGTHQTIEITRLTLVGLRDLVTSAVNGKNVIESLSGPIGIAKVVGQTSNYGFTAILTLVAILSINLAIFNALPLPALDGGRFVVVIIETIIKKKIPFKYYSWANAVGFILLLVLLVIVTIHDVRR